MKKNDLKSMYDNIKIDNIEKSKIYNNIMNNRKKRFNFMPIFGVGTLALASIFAFMFLGIPSNNGRNIALENSYKKEIIVNARQYLEANNIDLDSVGSELVIDSKDIVLEYNLPSWNFFPPFFPSIQIL